MKFSTTAGQFIAGYLISVESFSSSSMSTYISSTGKHSRFSPLSARIWVSEGLIEEAIVSRNLTALSEINPVTLTDKTDQVDIFCRWTNALFRNLTIEPVRNYLEMTSARSNMSFIEKLISPPQSPGISRPVSLTIAASVPTLLGWYGYYKFCVEEELFQDELKREGRVSGCGGYGTLLPFVFLFLIGSVTHFIPVLDAISSPCIEAGGIWILLGQINLYRRVNELTVEKFGGEPPLHSWWALLPPPLDVIVGLRQVHFLAKYWAAVRGDNFEKDVFADTLFPFISSDRFTLKQLVLEPRRWFWFTSNAEDFDFNK